MNFTFEKKSLAYDVPRWDRCLWDSRLEKHTTVHKSVYEIRNALQNSGSKATPQEHADRFAQNAEVASTFGSEVFSRLYGKPQKIEQACGWAPQAHKILDELPEWSNLQDQLKGDPDFSALTTASLLDGLKDRLPGLLDAMNKNPESQDGTPIDADALGRSGQAVRAAFRRAIEKAQEETSEAKEALNGIMPGWGNTPELFEQEDTNRLSMAEFILNNQHFQEVLRRAGRLQRIAARDAKRRDEHAIGTVVGLERGADLDRVLPAAIANLGHPVLRTLVYRDFAERMLMQYKVEGQEPQGKGPVVVLIDESGSMQGENETWAHAVCIAAISQAQKENRDVKIGFFQTSITSAYTLHAGEVRHCNPQTGEPNNRFGNIGELIKLICTRRSGGGTDFSQPMNWALNCIVAENERSDVIFVTDGYAYVSAPILARTEAEITRGVRIYGLLAGGGSVGSALAALCTEIVDLARVPEDQIAKRLAGAVPIRE